MMEMTVTVAVLTTLAVVSVVTVLGAIVVNCSGDDPLEWIAGVSCVAVLIGCIALCVNWDRHVSREPAACPVPAEVPAK